MGQYNERAHSPRTHEPIKYTDVWQKVLEYLGQREALINRGVPL